MRTVKKPNGMTYMRNAVYAVYKGDELLVIGTQKECATALGVQPKYIHWLATPSGRKRQANSQNPDRVTTAEVIDWEKEKTS